MLRIDTPAYARPVEVAVDPEFEEEYHYAQEQCEAIIAVFDQAIEAYLAEYAYDEPEMFPSRQSLTGEYYIGYESYQVREEKYLLRPRQEREYRFSIMAHCLEHRTTIDDQDYLGLEVHFTWLPEQRTFTFMGDINSSSI